MLLFFITNMAAVTSTAKEQYRVEKCDVTLIWSQNFWFTGWDWQKNNFARASHFFVHFLAVVARLRHETSQFYSPALSSGWALHKNFSFSFSKLRDGPFGFNPENFANMKLNKIYEVWNSANPLFKWRFDLLSSRNFATMATWRKIQLTTSPLHCICKKKSPIVQFDITLTQSHSDP